MATSRATQSKAPIHFNYPPSHAPVFWFWMPWGLASTARSCMVMAPDLVPDGEQAYGGLSKVCFLQTANKFCAC